MAQYLNLNTGLLMDECDFYAFVSGETYDCCTQYHNVWMSGNMAKNEYEWQQYFIANPPACGSPYTLTLTYSAGNAPSQSLGDWNTLLDGNYTAVSVVGDTVLLTGGSGVTIHDNAFTGEVNLLSVADDGSIVGIGDNTFDNCSNAASFVFSSATIVGAEGFRNCFSLNNIELPACTDLGGTTGNDGVFGGISGNTITATFRTSLATCDGGNPDGDIVVLESNNTCTIIYV